MPKATAAPAAPQPLISDKRLRHLYATLLECGALRQHLKTKRRTASSAAGEAIVTGTVAHLEEDDVLMTTGGDRWSGLARGHSLRKVLSGARLPGILPPAGSAAACFAIATGYALAQRHEDGETKRIALAFSGPGVTTLDGLAQPLAFAAANKAGVIFVIETAADEDVSGPRHTDKLGLPGIPVDGNDVIAIYRVAQEAVTRARRGGGPTLIDCKPWPLQGKANPVGKLEETLARRGLLRPDQKQRTLAAFAARLRDAEKKTR